MPAALERSSLAMMYPGLCRLLLVPGFVGAMADAKWLENIGPLLKLPDFTSGEEARWIELLNVAPDLKEFDLPERQPAASAARLNLRRAAVRCIALAAGLGKQTFEQTSQFGGEPFLKLPIEGGHAVKLGRGESVRWDPAPVPMRAAKGLLGRPGLIPMVEQALMPLIGAGEEMFDRQVAFWAALMPLRRFDAQSRFPLLLPGVPLPAVPQGYEKRYELAETEAVGVPYNVAAKIATPFIAKVVRQVRTELVAEGPDHEKAEEILAWALDRADSGT